jgi:hypothetical protein
MPFSESDCHTPSAPDLARAVGRDPVGHAAGQQVIGRCYFPLGRQVGVDDLHDLPLQWDSCGDQAPCRGVAGFLWGSPKPLARPADPTRITQVPLGAGVQGRVQAPEAGTAPGA